MALFTKKQQNEPRRRQPGIQKERATDQELDQRYAFRRNRTLTGSSSSQIASTNELNAQLKSPRVQAHALIRQRRHIGLILLLVLAGAAALFGLISQFTASVVVKAQDASIQLDAKYVQTIQHYLSERPIERLRFVLNKNELNGYIQTAIPEVKSVEVEGAAGFGTSSFILTMREPIAGWSIRGQQQYVDNTGTAFSRNYFPAPKVQIIDNSGVEVNAGQAIASNRFLGFVGRVVGVAKTKGYVTQQVIIPAGTSRQIELRITGIAYPIKFSVDREAGEQVEDMTHGISWLTSHSVTPVYLDVRVSGKAFYR
jgi:hypothetical protein